MGGIFIVKRKGEWKVEVYEKEAPPHDHLTLTSLDCLNPSGHPDLSKFRDDMGILIGHNLETMPSVFFLDGIIFTEKDEGGEVRDRARV